MIRSSMGGGVSFADVLRTNREQILTLPDATIRCPGHGPRRFRRVIALRKFSCDGLAQYPTGNVRVFVL